MRSIDVTVLFISSIILWALGPASVGAQSPGTCPPANGIAVQVLGSGGPIADDDRASSAYLVWENSKARLLVDAGGGSFLRFGQAGARFEDLDVIAISHFHTDHSADFPALLKSGYFSDRSRPLTVSGPSGTAPFPSLKGFLEALLSPDAGANAYLSGYLDGSDGMARLIPFEVEVSASRAISVFNENGMHVQALGVPHGIVPTLAFRVAIGGKVIIFASDQNGMGENFIGFASNADLMVAHMAIPEHANGAAVRLHARPSRIGEISESANVDTLLLSHFMARSLAEPEKNISAVKQAFAGNIRMTKDLDCIIL